MLLGLHVHYDHMETAQSSHTSTSDTNNWEKENYQVLQMFLRISSTLNIYIYIKRERERERENSSTNIHAWFRSTKLPSPSKKWGSFLSFEHPKFQASNKNSKTDISKLPLNSWHENKGSPADISSKNISLTFGEEGEVDKAAVKQLRATACQEMQIYEYNDDTEELFLCFK